MLRAKKVKSGVACQRGMFTRQVEWWGRSFFFSRAGRGHRGAAPAAACALFPKAAAEEDVDAPRFGRVGVGICLTPEDAFTFYVWQCVHSFDQTRTLPRLSIRRALKVSEISRNEFPSGQGQPVVSECCGGVACGHS